MKKTSLRQHGPTLRRLLNELDGKNGIAVNTPLAFGHKDIQLLELSLGSHGIITALIWVNMSALKKTPKKDLAQAI